MKIIFIGGAGRSGTTLVQKLLVIHSKIAGGEQFEYLHYLMPVYNRMKEMDQLGMVKDKPNHFYTQTQLNDYWKAFIEQFFVNVFKLKEGAEYFSEKTTANIYVADTLLDLFPDSKFIYVYRDGRDVVSSHKQVNLRYKQNNKPAFTKNVVPYISMYWRDVTSLAHKLKSNPKYSNRVFALRYEALVTNPEDVLKKLMDFIGEPLEAKQLDPSAFSSDALKMNVVDNIWYNEKMFTQKINTGNIGKWREDLNVIDKFIVNILLAYRLQQEGYKVKAIYCKLNWLFFKTLKLFGYRSAENS